MKLHEEVYTSAAELLDRSSGNLGIVARTKQFPNELEPELQSYRGYSLLPGFRNGSPDHHPPRFVLGPCRSGQDAYGVTRVGYAGADHTGRTTPLAHHVVLNRREMQTEGIPPWLVVWSLRDLFHCRWQQPPAWIDPQRTIDLSDMQVTGVFRSSECASSPEQYKRSLIAAVDALAQYPVRQQPVVLCLPTERADSALGLIIDVLQLLPISLQSQVVAISHVVEVSDYVRDAWLMVTYPGTPFYERCRGRLDTTKPVIIDLSSVSSEGIALSEFGQTISDLWQGEDPTSVFLAMKIWDQVGIRTSSISVFSKVISLRRRIQNLSKADQLPDLVGRFAECYTALDRPEALKEWSLKLVSDRVMNFPRSDRAQSLATIRLDERWPTEARAEAWRGMIAHPDDTIPLLLEMITDADASRELALKAALRSLLTSRPSYLADSLSRAIESGDAHDARLASLLLNCGSLPVGDLVAACSRLITGGKDSNDILLASLIRSLGSRPLEISETAALCDYSIEHGAAPWQTWRLVALPTLLKQWESAGPKDAERLAQVFLKSAMRTGTLISDLQSLLDRRRHKITYEMADLWLKETTPTFYRDEVHRVLISAGLVAVPEAQRESAIPAVLVRGTRQMQPMVTYVGPILFPICLAITALILSVIHLSAWKATEQPMKGFVGFWTTGPSPGFTLILLLLVAATYWVGEFLVRIWARNSSTFGAIAAFRWLLTLALCAAIGYAALPSVASLIRDLWN